MQHKHGKLNTVTINEPYVRIGERDEEGKVVSCLVHAQYLAHIIGEVFEWDGFKLAIGGNWLKYTLIDSAPWIDIGEFGEKCNYEIYLCEHPLSAHFKPLPNGDNETRGRQECGNDRGYTPSVINQLSQIADKLTESGYRQNNDTYATVYGSQDIHIIMLNNDRVIYSTLAGPIGRITIEGDTARIRVPLYYKYPAWPDKCDIVIQCANEYGHETYFDLINCNKLTWYLDVDVNKAIIKTIVTYKAEKINGPYTGRSSAYNKAVRERCNTNA